MSSELKTQFLNYMTLQRFSDHTKRSYVTGVKLLSKYYMQSPDTLTNEQIQDYIRHLLEERKLSWGTCNSYLSGMVCFYRHICNWDDTQFQIPPRPRVKKLPVVFSQPEVKRLLAATDNLKHRLLLRVLPVSLSSLIFFSGGRQLFNQQHGRLIVHNSRASICQDFGIVQRNISAAF
jgi:integrase/recombinase XerD